MLEQKQTVRAVDRALQLLKCFTFERKEISLAEISKISKLPKTTAFRLLVSLEEQGFVIKDEVTQNYRLGILLFKLGSIVASDMELRKVSLPVLEEIANKTKETVNINIVQNNERFCIEKIEGSHDLRQFIDIGKGLPLYKGASGKILMAYLPLERQIKMLDNIKEDLGKSKSELLTELQNIKEKGLAISHDERVLGAASVSAPIYNHIGDVVAGLTISSASVRFTEERVEEFTKMALEGAMKISSALGYGDGSV